MTLPTRHVALGPGGEFDRIRAIWDRLGDRATGGGDDCAVVEVGGERLAWSVDLSVEGTHFRQGWMSLDEIGWRVASAALSDLAAVAATPLGVMASVGLPAEWPEQHLTDLMEGVGAAAAAVGAVVMGGDLVRATQLAVDVSVIGRLTQAPVRRSGARPGDDLWVTGRLGGPFAALAAWNAGVEPDRAARERFVHPVPRIQEAAWLREHGARAMIDLSDGLVADAGHLASASGVGWTIEVDSVPLHPAAEAAEMALAGGEEYELLAAVPPGLGVTQAREFAERFGIPLTRVGHADQPSAVRLIRDGKRVWAPDLYQHF
ncbi:MAG TPA: thiamine-phosphate kinase [Gemmatimonadales bacterium]|nr:thiamine-phosphate kinase [Gemmatimonadales bacterium]